MMLVNFKKLVRIAGQAVLPGKTPAVTGAIGYRALLITLRWSKHIRLFLAQNGIGRGVEKNSYLYTVQIKKL